MSDIEEKIKQKAQLLKTGFSRELHREGHFVITLDSNGKIELTRYHPISETHILVNPWFGDVLALLEGKAIVERQQLFEEMRKLLPKYINRLITNYRERNGENSIEFLLTDFEQKIEELLNESEKQK